MREGRSVWKWGIALLLLTVVTRLPALMHPHYIDDESIYAAVALEMVEGGLPYIDAVERKPPLLFAVYATVFNALGSYNWVGLHAVAVLWVVATMLGLFVIGRALFDGRVGIVVALLYSVFQSWAFWKNLAFNGEVLMNLPIVWACAIVFRRTGQRLRPDLLVAGMLVCSGFLLKQPAAAAAVPLGLYLLLPSYRRSRGVGMGGSVVHAMMFTAGFWGTLGLAALYLSHLGIYDEAYYWTFTDHDVPHGITDPVFWMRGTRMWVAFVAACAPLVWGAVRSLHSGTAEGRLWETRPAEFSALWGLLIASAVGTAASGRFYPITSSSWSRLWPSWLHPP